MMLSPWDRLDNESETAHEAFLAYRDLGSARTLPGAREKLGKDSGYDRVLEEWSGKTGWVERCRAWDNHLQEKRDRAKAAHAVKWERRRLAELEDVYEVGTQLRRLVKVALKFPMEKRTVESRSEDGKTVNVTTIEPARWSFKDIVSAATVSAQLIAASLAATDADPADLSDAELESLRNAAIEFAGE